MRPRVSTDAKTKNRINYIGLPMHASFHQTLNAEIGNLRHTGPEI